MSGTIQYPNHGAESNRIDCGHFTDICVPANFGSGLTVCLLAETSTAASIYHGTGPIMNPSVPFVHNVGDLYPNKMIIISGIPNQKPSRFTVYLQHGRQYEPNDIAMCVDARFNFCNDRNVVLRNSRMSGAWQHEERDSPYFPFAPNAGFTMIIMVDPYCFKVAVNNQHLLVYNHKIQPLTGIDHVRVDGDVRLTQVSFQ